MMRARLTPDQRQAVQRAYKAGTPVDEIAVAHRCSRALVCKLARKAGLPYRGRGGMMRVGITTDKRHAIAAAYKAGRKLEEIAVTFGCSPGSICNIAWQAGIPRRGRGKREGII